MSLSSTFFIIITIIGLLYRTIFSLILKFFFNSFLVKYAVKKIDIFTVYYFQKTEKLTAAPLYVPQLSFIVNRRNQITMKNEFEITSADGEFLRSRLALPPLICVLILSARR